MKPELGSGFHAALELQREIRERYRSGERVRIFLQLPKNLTGDEIRRIESDFKGHGIDIMEPVLMGTMEGWPYALKIELLRPTMGVSSRDLPLAVLFHGALLGVGIDNLTGWIALKA